MAEEIIKNNKELKKENKLYKKTIKTLAEQYKIPEVEVYKILKAKMEKDKETNKGKQRER